MNANPLESKILDFSTHPDNVLDFAAFLKVGNDSGEDTMTVLSKAMVHLLLRFHGIPTKSEEAGKGNN